MTAHNDCTCMEEMRLINTYSAWFDVYMEGSVHYPRVFLHIQDGETALYIASKNGHVAIVNFLLQDIQADVRICQKVWNSEFPCHCI